ncbi:MAG: NAD-binding protein, partial [Pseudomonadota bacterium]
MFDVCICGVGHVGYPMAKVIAANGLRVIACDIDPYRIEEISENLNVVGG